MKRYIPNLLTCLNIGIGTYGIYYLATYADLNKAIYFIAICALLDLFDGLLARFLRATSEIGKQLDSLADLVSFGVLPAIFLIIWIPNEKLSWIGIFVAVFSALRLALFNLSDSHDDDFKGLPTPANAIMIVSLAYLTWPVAPHIKSMIVLLSCFLLVAPIRFYSLKFSRLVWKGNEPRWAIVGFSILGLILLGKTYLTYSVPLYIMVCIIWTVIVKRENIFLKKGVS